MTVFSTAFSTATEWAFVAKELSDGLRPASSSGGGLGILYVSDTLAEDFKSIVTYLKQTSGVDAWVGTLGLGVIAGAEAAFDRSSAVVMIVDVPSEAYRLLMHSPIPGQWPQDVMDWAETVTPTCGLIHTDGATPNLAEHVETLSERTGAFLVGGITWSRGAQAQVSGDVGSTGVSGVLFSPEVPVTVGLTQGCSPVGPVRTVTGGEENVIMEIDGRPALEVFKEDIGEMLARDLQRVAGYVHVAFPISGTDTADYMVRSLLAIDPGHGWLGVGTEIAVGDQVMFVRRDPMSARADLERMVTDVQSRLQSPARGAVYISCVARGPEMFGSDTAEAELISHGLDGAPVVGFYAGGEISRDRLYGYTGVLLAFG